MGVAACIFIAAASLVSVAGFIWLDGLYLTQPREAVQAYGGFDHLQKGLLGTGRFALGAWLLLIDAFALRARRLPPRLAVLGILLGAGLMLAVAIPPVFVVTVLFLPWAGWLGILLLRRRSTPEPI